MAKTFDSISLSKLSDEEKSILAQCLISNPEDNNLPELALAAYNALKKQYDLDEGSLANARRNLPKLVGRAIKANGKEGLLDYPEDCYMIGGRLKREDLHAEIEALMECADVSTVAVTLCYSACANAREENGVVAMADFRDALTEEFKGISDNDCLAFFQGLSDDPALEILNASRPMEEIRSRIEEEARWIEAQAFVCRP